jgi:endonuclease YncB( thermonuclease family)
VTNGADPRDFRFRYDALVREVYDGDTFYVDIDQGLSHWTHGVGLRLHGIDTPELKRATMAAGLAARDFVCAALTGLPVGDIASFKKNRRRIILPEPVPIFLHSHGDDDGKYGRLLSTVWLYNEFGELVCLNELLLTTGHARVPSYA